MAKRFQVGDEVVWLLPVRCKVERSIEKKCVVGKVLDSYIHPKAGQKWNFEEDTGHMYGNEVTLCGMITHHHYKIEHGPTPRRRIHDPAYSFKHYEPVLVRDSENDIWQLAAFKGYTDEQDSPYEVYNGTDDLEYPLSCWRHCIPFAGNEDKLGTVAEWKYDYEHES